MNDRKSKDRRASGVRALVDSLTGRVGRVTALVGAVGALAVALLTNFDQIYQKSVELGLYQSPPCVVIDTLNYPATVKYSEWDSMRLELKGRNNCAKPLGLFVTFARRSKEASFHIRIPHEDLPQCKGTGAHFEPTCWDPKKPVIRGKGDWGWRILPPPLELLRETPSLEILVTWAVYDYDAPTKLAVHHDYASIRVHNDLFALPAAPGYGTLAVEKARGPDKITPAAERWQSGLLRQTRNP